MLQTLELLLPALIPSWRFFATIAPSPRIEFALLKTGKEKKPKWQEFRPRPQHVSVPTMFKRMLWNPQWNESLFTVSCAERIIANPTEHSKDEIATRIQNDLALEKVDVSKTPFLQFRLVFWYRDGKQLQKDITFVSPIYKVTNNATA